jgi:sugar-specific transcriptional regulator TrmB
VQKRRIYDITNVLEGIGLIQKISKNKIQWTADFKDVYTQNYINQLHKRFTELEIEEQELDKLISLKEKETSELLKNNLQYSYIYYNDIKQLPEARDDTILAIKAPIGTKMEVPVTPVNSYPISIRSSNSEPISVSIISPLSPTTDTPNSSLLSDPITPTDHNTVSTSADDSLEIPWLSMDSLSNQSDFEDYYLTVYKAGEGIADIYTENWDDNIQLGDKRFSENENNEQRM